MARGVNKVILIGNVGQDPEVKYMPSGGAVTNISVATTDSWKDKNSGEQQERTEWHRVVFFNRLGEIAGEYLKKGSKVYIEGSLRTRKWQAQDGTDRFTTEIVANEMQMLDGRDNSNQGYSPQDNNQGVDQSQGYQQPYVDQQQPQNRQQQAPQGRQQQQPAQGGHQQAPQGRQQQQPAQGRQQQAPQGRQQQAPQYEQQQGNQYNQQPQHTGGHNMPAGFDSFDDDIPFRCE